LDAIGEEHAGDKEDAGGANSYGEQHTFFIGHMNGLRSIRAMPVEVGIRRVLLDIMRHDYGLKKKRVRTYG
jgi:hypothetical protein